MPGESARAQYERIRSARRERLRHGRRVLLVVASVGVVVGAIGTQLLVGSWWPGAFLAIVIVASQLTPTQRETAWRKGAEGEEAVGRTLDCLAAPAVALHDRKIPRSRANVDHILIAPSGVWTIDAKNYSGKLETRRGGRELRIGGRDRSKLLDQARGQAEVVRQCLAAAGLDAPVTPVLCFLGVEWPLLFPPREAAGVRLVSRRGLAKLSAGDSPLSTADIRRIRDALDRGMPPMTAKDGKPRPSVDGPPAAERPPIPSDTTSPSSDLAELAVNPWRRYGKNRLYVNGRDGTTLGYVDLETNEVVVEDERYREIVARAVQRYLRDG